MCESYPGSRFMKLINERDLRIDAMLILHECSFEGWDGYGAPVITNTTFAMIAELAYWLPKNIEHPDVVPCPDATMDLTWEKDLETINEFGNRELDKMMTLSCDSENNQFVFSFISGPKLKIEKTIYFNSLSSSEFKEAFECLRKHFGLNNV